MAKVGGNTVKSILDITGYKVTIPSDITKDTGSIKQVSKDLDALAAVSRNKAYVEQLRIEVGTYMAKLNNASFRSPKKYYNKLTGKYQAFKPTTITNTLGTASSYMELAQSIAYLVQYKVIGINTKFNVKPINLYTGKFAEKEDAVVKREISELLGFPAASGLITVSKRINDVNKFGYTYTAVDITANAAFGNIITEVKGLNAVSWSIHQDKNSDRRSHEDKPTQFTKGAKTYAGTLIFSLFNEDPARSFTPIEFFHGNSPIAPASGMTSFHEMDATELPAFDLILMFNNEYGASSSMMLWGVEFTDTGGSITTRQGENEVSFQYKCIGMDPITPVRKGTNGQINPWEPTAAGMARFEQSRQLQLMSSMAGQNFEQMYKNSINSVYKKLKYV